jgi:hypothetical protein
VSESHVPAVLIRIELENKRPVVRCVYTTDADAARLELWLSRQRELLALLDYAIQLEEAETT